MSAGGHLTAVDPPDVGEVHGRFMALREAARLAEQRVVIGGLCAEFTNEEIHMLAEHLLSIGEVLTLRRLGLLAPDEGFDGSKASRTNGQQITPSERDDNGSTGTAS